MSNLVSFENFNVEFLTKEDVNFEFNGDVIFNGIQTTEILGYANPAKAIIDHVEEEFKHLVTKEKLVSNLEMSLGQRGSWYIEEDGIIDLTYKSKLPQAEKFRKIVRTIIKQVQTTGRYDATENKIMEVEDSREKQLRLKLYKIQQVLEIDPDDRFMQIQLKDAEKELQLYQHTVEIEQVKLEMKVLTETVEKVQEQSDLIKNQQLYICNRTNFDERIKILANKYYGRDIQKAYGELFGKMRMLGSFDVHARRKNEWEKINAERAKDGKKPYKSSTLKQQYNNLDVIDDYNKWELASEAYKTIETEFVSGN